VQHAETVFGFWFMSEAL